MKRGDYATFYKFLNLSRVTKFGLNYRDDLIEKFKLIFQSK